MTPDAWANPVSLPAGTVIAAAALTAFTFAALFWLAWYDGRRAGRHEGQRRAAEDMAGALAEDLDRAFKAGWDAAHAAIAALAERREPTVPVLQRWPWDPDE